MCVDFPGGSGRGAPTTEALRKLYISMTYLNYTYIDLLHCTTSTNTKIIMSMFSIHTAWQSGNSSTIKGTYGFSLPVGHFNVVSILNSGRQDMGHCIQSETTRCL